MTNITLTGFGTLDEGARSVAERMIKNHSAHLQKKLSDITDVQVTVKVVHGREKGEIYEIHGHVKHKGGVVVVKTEQRNLFMCLDDVFKKLETQLERTKSY